MQGIIRIHLYAIFSGKYYAPIILCCLFESKLVENFFVVVRELSAHLLLAQRVDNSCQFHKTSNLSTFILLLFLCRLVCHCYCDC